MPRNGELPNCQRWYISDVAFPAYIEVSLLSERSCKFNFIYGTIPLWSYRWPALRGRGARMAAQESFPSAWTEYFHVRPDSSGGGICCLHRVPAAVLQAGAATTSATSQAIVMRFRIEFLLLLLWNWKLLKNIYDIIYYYYEGLPACRESDREEEGKRANEKFKNHTETQIHLILKNLTNFHHANRLN